jgi:hypothetical protein
MLQLTNVRTLATKLMAVEELIATRGWECGGVSEYFELIQYSACLSSLF